GLGACLVLRARGAETWAAFALAAALLHTLNHAVFKALLFLGAGAFEKAVGVLEIDRLGGLLRRMPWTGWAFLVGAMAIAGLAPWTDAEPPVHVGLPLPGTGSLPTGGILIALVALTGALLLLRGGRRALPAPTWACGQLVEPGLEWTSAGFTKPLRLVLEVV